MYCNNCGKQLSEGATFCTECGTKVESKVSNSEVIGSLNEPVSVTNPNPNNTNYSTMKILSFILIFVASVIGGFFGYKLYDKATSKSSTNNSGNVPATPISNEVKGVTISFNGYTYIVPEKVHYDIDETSVYLQKNDWTWEGSFSVYEKAISDIISDKDSVAGYFQDQGATVIKTSELNVNNKSCLVIYLEYQNREFYVGYVAAGISTVTGFEFYTEDGKFNEDALNELLNILTTGKFVGSTKSVSTNSLKDLNFVGEAIQ